MGIHYFMFVLYFEIVNIAKTRQVSSMIHSARTTITPAANIVCCFVFLDFKSGDGRTTCAKAMIPT